MREEYNKITEELKEEIKKNNEIINKCDERKRMSNVNQFEYKAIETISFSMLPYLGLVLSSSILFKNGVPAPFTGTFVTGSFPFIIVGSSLCVGTIGRKILEWKYKTKERLNSYTTANNQWEKLEEEVKYTVELEKAINRNKAIRQTLDSLKLNESISNSLPSSYNFNNQNKPRIVEETKKRVEYLAHLLKEKYTELDVLTTQKILHEKFWRVRMNGQKVMDIIMAGAIGGLLTMMYGEVPLIVIRDYINFSGPMSVLAPYIVGGIGFSGYMIKRNNDYIKAFNSLNKELGEDALPDKLEESYKEPNFDTKIDNIIREISIVENQLLEQKSIVDAFSTGSNDNEDSMKKVVSKEYTIEHPQKDPVYEYSQEDLMAFMTDKESERESKIEEKGTQLVLKRKTNYTQRPQK